VGFFAREQLKILLWRDGVEMAESVHRTVPSIVNRSKGARGSVFVMRSYTRQDRLITEVCSVVRFVIDALVRTHAKDHLSAWRERDLRERTHT
jgi:sulfur transfer complex TusBCD TusB component (DsrH family)